MLIYFTTKDLYSGIKFEQRIPFSPMPWTLLARQLTEKMCNGFPINVNAGNTVHILLIVTTSFTKPVRIFQFIIESPFWLLLQWKGCQKCTMDVFYSAAWTSGSHIFVRQSHLGRWKHLTRSPTDSQQCPSPHDKVGVEVDQKLTLITFFAKKKILSRFLQVSSQPKNFHQSCKNFVSTFFFDVSKARN